MRRVWEWWPVAAWAAVLAIDAYWGQPAYWAAWLGLLAVVALLRWLQRGWTAADRKRLGSGTRGLAYLLASLALVSATADLIRGVWW